MKTKIGISISVLIVSVLFVFLSNPDIALGQEKIKKLGIAGNRRIETQIIQNEISSTVGEDLSSEKIGKDIKSIYKLGFFEDVTAEIEQLTDGLILVFRVREKPVVSDVRIRGNKDIDDDDIEEVINVQEGRIVEKTKINQSLESIRRLYSSEGFINTEVDVDIEPKAAGTISIIYNIKEGKKAFIKKVKFIGNKNIKDKKLKDGIYSRPKWFLSVFTHRGLYNYEEIERDSDRIKSKYLEKGYIDVKVSKPEVEFKDELDGFELIFRIEEGKRYYVSFIDFSGDLIVPVEELQDLLQLKPEGPFNSKSLSGDLVRLTIFYGDKGYAFANVDPKFDKNTDASTVGVTFELEKGVETYIRKIDIVGNTRTRDKVLRREIPIQESDRFSTTRLEAIKRRVFRLGFFEENVEIQQERVEGSDDQLDVKVKVTEKPTGFFSVAGGFSSVETFIFAGQVQESNLFGYGKRLTLSAQIGGVTRFFLINYQDPNFLDTDWTFEVRLFNNDVEFRDFDRKSLGGSITFGRRVWRNLIARVAYRAERVRIGDVSGDVQLLISQSNRTISTPGVGLSWDSRNNLLDPTKGWIASTFIEYAGGVFGGNTDFVRYTANGRYFLPLPLKTVLTFSGNYGYLDLSGAGDDLVISERFFLGGPRSLRGFEFRRVGPRVPTDDGDFVIIGGTQQILASADFVFPLATKLGVKGVVFFDIGNVFNDNENLSFDPNDLKKDFGLGIKWVSPFGPLRLEVGFPIGERLEGEDSFEIQFTIGNLF